MIYFMSMLGNEYIKIGYTAQDINKRKSALQTGNPYEIEILFSIDGTLKQEKEIHRSLREAFERVKVFNNPVNEWYPGKNSMIKMFMSNVRTFGLTYALQNLNSIFNWDIAVEKDEVFTIRHLEKALRKHGLSRTQAKTMISQNKVELMAGTYNKYIGGVIDEMVRNQS